MSRFPGRIKHPCRQNAVVIDMCKLELGHSCSFGLHTARNNAVAYSITGGRKFCLSPDGGGRESKFSGQRALRGGKGFGISYKQVRAYCFACACLSSMASIELSQRHLSMPVVSLKSD